MAENDANYTVSSIMKDLERRGQVIAVMQYPHPKDRYLFVVLMALDNQYVVSMYNAEVNSFFSGNYFLLPYYLHVPFNHTDMIAGTRQHHILLEAYKCFHEKLSARLSW